MFYHSILFILTPRLYMIAEIPPSSLTLVIYDIYARDIYDWGKYDVISGHFGCV
jgi:hypothetical protein